MLYSRFLLASLVLCDDLDGWNGSVGGRYKREESEVKVTQSHLTLWPHGLYSPWNSPDQNTGVGILSLLQVIFLTQGSNPGLQHCRWVLYQLSHKGSPRILERVAYPFSKGSSQPRNRTGVSCIAGRFLTNWAMREARAKGRRYSWFTLLYSRN